MEDLVNNDRHIKKLADDKLNIGTFCESLGDSLVNYSLSDENDAIVVGIYGEWGSGKSSVIEMTEDYIKNITNERIKGLNQKRIESKKKPNEKPKFIYFNPWYFSGQDDLISKFFLEIAHNLEHSELNKLDSLKLTTSRIKRIGKIFTFLHPKADVIAESFEDAYNHIVELNNLKRELDKALNDLNFKLVIVIDDIDRLKDNEIMQIFQLVKCVADFKNIIYVLAFDEKVVSNALDNFQDGFGEEFLEKIIQVPHRVPRPHKTEIRSLLEERIKKIIGKDPKNIERYLELYSYGLKHMIKNIRDINRYTNVLKMSWNLVKDKVNETDFLAITAIKVFMPKIYDFIWDNKGDFLTQDYNDPKLFRTDPSIFKDKYHELLPYYKFINKVQMNSLINLLFPKSSAFLIKQNPEANPQVFYDLNKRICSENSFDIYFKLSTSKYQIPVNDLEYILSENITKSGYQIILESIIDDGLMDYYFKKVTQLVDQLPQKNRSIFITTCFDLEKECIRADSRIMSSLFTLFDQLLDNFRTSDEKNSFKDIINVTEQGIFLPMLYTVTKKSKLSGTYEDILTLMGSKMKSYIENGQDAKFELIYDVLRMQLSDQNPEYWEIPNVVIKIIRYGFADLSFNLDKNFGKLDSKLLKEYLGKYKNSEQFVRPELTGDQKILNNILDYKIE